MKPLNFTLLFFLFFKFSILFSQTKTPEAWQALIGGEEYANSKSKDLVTSIYENDYSYALTGFSMIVEKYFQARTDKSGKVLSWKFFDDQLLTIYAEIQTPDKGFIFSATLPDESYNKFPLLFKTDSSGNILWKKEYREYPEKNSKYWVIKAIVPTDSGYLLFMQINLNSILLLKINEEGEKIFSKEISLTDYEYEIFNQFIILKSGDFFICGSSDMLPSNQKQQDTRVIKLSSDGNIIWKKNYGIEDVADYPNCILATKDGGCIIGGGKQKADIHSVENRLIKIDADGNIQWQKNYGRGLLQKVCEVSDAYIFNTTPVEKEGIMTF